ncbi:MAG TPA: N-acetylglucosamine-6-phosphate deacetylase [Actinobacteria bacterium]|jgi:N-acetylglucosamine-6-phosphate deacetylase|nr:N-acetylglucosamine-6-phosphate deacetylase [Actinomycetota bacterium]
MTTYACAHAVTPEGLVDDVAIEVDDGIISSVTRGLPVGPDVVDLGDVTVVPGFVDMHVHGGGSYSFSEGPQAATRAAAFHLQHGTTSLLASLASASLDDLAEQTVQLRPLVDAGVLAGLHLEGPFLNECRRGAHNPVLLMDPDVDWLLSVLGNGVKMVTLAPELEGGLDSIRAITAAGVVAALGHSDATYEQAVEAIEAGVRVGTHLFNGMRPPHHREPGAVLALMRDPRVTVELISDGVHLHRALLASVLLAAGPSRVALITDAISATGMPDGLHELAGSQVRVTDGVAELADGSSLAGSTLTMDDALRNTVNADVPFVDAVVAASTTPARTLGLHDRGSIAAGLRADLVALDPEFRVRAVMQAGTLVTNPSEAQVNS